MVKTVQRKEYNVQMPEIISDLPGSEEDLRRVSGLFDARRWDGTTDRDDGNR